MSDGRDDTRRPRGWDADEDGSAARPLLWLLGGLVLAVLLGAAMAPELLTDLGAAAQLALLAAVAGIPGLVVLLVVAARRRGGEPADDTSGGEG